MLNITTKQDSITTKQTI